MSAHDTAGCSAPSCPLCEAYGDGYAVGKAKAHNETRAQALDDTHGEGCGCQPCRTVRIVTRSIRRSVLEELNSEPVLLPEQHLRDCQGPGCGATCRCWCHRNEPSGF